MEDVAEHVNEMQRIHDEYGQIFDDLSRSRPTIDAAVSTTSGHARVTLAAYKTLMS